ncbi:hypothetical protein fugu_009280 [Takifugu bimaculatus]|uniref:Uncharacterized protein n=1 Tax=Takifugu bimaculatus TaxID=433685 RepID=A0A4Z2AY78_9TELE|nr:hypothetical protein fugu_009280 [Takifugu bimaculatus]
MLTTMVSVTHMHFSVQNWGEMMRYKSTRQPKSDMLSMVAVTSHDPPLHEGGLSAASGCRSPSDHAHFCVLSLNRSQGENCRDTVIPSHETLSSSCPHPPHTHPDEDATALARSLRSPSQKQDIDNESPQLSIVSSKHESA